MKAEKWKEARAAMERIRAMDSQAANPRDDEQYQLTLKSFSLRSLGEFVLDLDERLQAQQKVIDQYAAVTARAVEGLDRLSRLVETHIRGK